MKEAGGAFFHEFRDGVVGRVAAVRGGEGVVYIDVAEGRELFAQLGIVLFLAGIKPDVFKQGDVAVLEGVGHFFTSSPRGVSMKSIFFPRSLLRRSATGFRLISGTGLPLGLPMWDTSMILHPSLRQ